MWLWSWLIGCGTEIGDEGPADCTERSIALDDPARAAEGFDWSVVEALDAVAGTFTAGSVALSLEGTAADATLSQWRPTPTAAPGTACPDRYALPVRVALAYPPALDESGDGWLEILDDGTAFLHFDVDLAELRGESRPGFDTDGSMSTILRVHGRYADGAWDVDATWWGEIPRGDGTVEEPTETVFGAHLR